MASKQSIQQALKLIRAGKMRITSMHGLPEGGWAETAQARSRLVDDLPPRAERSYSVDDLISALYELDSADRYRLRESA